MIDFPVPYCKVLCPNAVKFNNAADFSYNSINRADDIFARKLCAFKPVPFSSVVNVHNVLLLQVRGDDSSDDLMRGRVSSCLYF